MVFGLFRETRIFDGKPFTLQEVYPNMTMARAHQSVLKQQGLLCKIVERMDGIAVYARERDHNEKVELPVVEEKKE